MPTLDTYTHKGEAPQQNMRYVIVAHDDGKIMLARTDTLVIVPEDSFDDAFEAAEGSEW